MQLTKLFREFFNSEKSGGLLLLICTITSFMLSHSAIGPEYLEIWQIRIAGINIEHWINDGLMAIFFLLIGLEMERELYVGELSDIKNASFPIFAAIGGMLVPACIFQLFNYGTPMQAGTGIPMATDIAFAIGILSLLGKKVPGILKIFLTALAVIDDLGAIIIISVFYTKTLHFTNLLIALIIFGILLVLNRLKIKNLVPYLTGGVAMWYFIEHSGVHATITGVLLAFAIPFRSVKESSPSYILQHHLHKPVAFVILPLFALANTSFDVGGNWLSNLGSTGSLGIILGLMIGKPLGILLFSKIGTTLGIASIPFDLKWKHIIGAGFLAGIGFTMSIFISLLAFSDQELISNSKIAVLVASAVSGTIGFLWLKRALKEDVNEEG